MSSTNKLTTYLPPQPPPHQVRQPDIGIVYPDRHLIEQPYSMRGQYDCQTLFVQENAATDGPTNVVQRTGKVPSESYCFQYHTRYLRTIGGLTTTGGATTTEGATTMGGATGGATTQARRGQT